MAHNPEDNQTAATNQMVERTEKLFFIGCPFGPQERGEASMKVGLNCSCCVGMFAMKDETTKVTLTEDTVKNTAQMAQNGTMPNCLFTRRPSSAAAAPPPLEGGVN